MVTIYTRGCTCTFSWIILPRIPESSDTTSSSSACLCHVIFIIQWITGQASRFNSRRNSLSGIMSKFESKDYIGVDRGDSANGLQNHRQELYFGHRVCYVTQNEVFIYHSTIGSSVDKVLELLRAFSINLSESQMETNQTCKSLLKCKCRQCFSVIFKRTTEPLGPKVLQVPFILHYAMKQRGRKLEWKFHWHWKQTRL